jgi:hypothetical protein
MSSFKDVNKVYASLNGENLKLSLNEVELDALIHSLFFVIDACNLVLLSEDASNKKFQSMKRLSADAKDLIYIIEQQLNNFISKDNQIH